MSSTDNTAAIDLYLDLLAKALTRSLFEDEDPVDVARHYAGQSWKHGLTMLAARALRPTGIQLVRYRSYDPVAREYGRDWPSRAETMVGLRRLANARYCIESVLNDRVPGDLAEAGVWRGGTSIFMRGVLKAFGITDRDVWCADSFQGLPPPSPNTYPADADLHLDQIEYLSVNVETVRRNFARYGLLDDQVHFLVGWFKDTLPRSPIDRLSVLRLDGDLYESTMQVLDTLYPRLSVGGYCIIDDYGVIPACRQAVTDYRHAREIADELVEIDGSGVYWRRTS